MSLPGTPKSLRSIALYQGEILEGGERIRMNKLN